MKTFSRLDWAACLLLFVALALMLHAGDATYRLNDFVGFYQAGVLAGSGHLYDVEAAYRIERERFGTTITTPVVRPPYHALFFVPLSLLPYWTAYAVFQCFNVGIAAGLTVIAARHSRAAGALALVSVPLIVTLMNGQDCLFVVAFVVTALWLLRRGQDFWAGAVLALCAAKPHLYVLLPFALVLNRRWRALAGGAAGGLVLALVSAGVAGWDWPLQMLGAASGQIAEHGLNVKPTLHAVLAGWGVRTGVVEAIASLLIATVAVIAMKRTKDVAAAIGIALVAGVVISVHAYVQDCVVLVLAYTLIGRAQQLLAVACLPPIYLAVLVWGWPFNAILAAMLVTVVAVAAFAPAQYARSFSAFSTSVST